MAEGIIAARVAMPVTSTTMLERMLAAGSILLEIPCCFFYSRIEKNYRIVVSSMDREVIFNTNKALVRYVR